MGVVRTAAISVNFADPRRSTTIDYDPFNQAVDESPTLGEPQKNSSRVGSLIVHDAHGLFQESEPACAHQLTHHLLSRLPVFGLQKRLQSPFPPHS